MKLNYPVKSVFSACLAYAAIAIGYTSEVQAQTAKVIKVKTDHSIAKVQPNMWGVFFEDINFGADGGIYAELIKTALSNLQNR
jgi:alpha-N-arabinofuranosidase